jgi:hypothetical protein
VETPPSPAAAELPEASSPADAASILLTVIDDMCVADRPSEPLRQLCGEVAGLEVPLGHALAEHDLRGSALTRRVCDTMI